MEFQTRSGRAISFYGAEYADAIHPLKVNRTTQTLSDFFEAMLRSWCRETAYPSSQADYDGDTDPTYGQCAITATLVYDVFGGSIHKIRVSGGGTHYFNKIDGHYIDLTRDQFDLYDLPLEYEPNTAIDRAYCGKNADTQKRYTILKERLAKVLRERLEN